MEKVDYKKTLKHLYRPSAKKVEFVDVPKMNFLMIDGQGNPNESSEFQQAMEALFPMAYTLKFMAKEQGSDYVVPPLEALWWADDMTAFCEDRRDEWKWTVMIMQPECITQKMADDAMEKVRQKSNPPAPSLMRFEAFAEGRCAQTMHIGPFENEGPTIERVQAFITENGGKLRDKHHEIYLSDIRRAAPEKWKTVSRQPAG
jgi:hypothetical protein